MPSHPTGRLRAPVKTLTIVGIIVLSAGKLSTDTDAPRPYILGMVTGNQQTAAAGTQLTDPLSVVVIDQYNFVMANITVTWAITAGGGSLSALTTVTDENGVASVTYTAGPTPGPASITATVSSLGTLTFTETIT